MAEFLILLFMAWLAVSVGVAFHAGDNGKTAAWGAVVLFSGIFGMVAYAISLASD
jgi:hypothetical protein